MIAAGKQRHGKQLCHLHKCVMLPAWKEVLKEWVATTSAGVLHHISTKHFKCIQCIPCSFSSVQSIS
jgi:hypothetical protein